MVKGDDLENDDSINLAVLESLPGEAETVSQDLRNAGHVIKLFVFESYDQLATVLKEGFIDVIFCINHSDELTDIISLARQKNDPVPVIAIASDADVSSVMEAMEIGAMDLVDRNQSGHLRLVFERELQSIRRFKAMGQCKEFLDESEKRCRALLDSSRDAIAYVHDGMYIYANRVYVELFGFEGTDDLEGLPIMDMIAENDQQRFREFIVNYARQPETYEKVEFRCERDDGTEFDAQMEFSRASIDGEPCTQLIIRDKIYNDDATRELEVLKMYDVSTGLLNRQAFLDEMEQGIADAQADDKSSVIFYIELDKFDVVREALSIEDLDVALTSIGRVFKEAIDDGDLGSRFGEGIFTLITHTNDSDLLKKKSRKILEMMNTILEVGDKSMKVTASMGMVAIRNTSRLPYEVLACADIACKAAKQQGGNRVEVYVYPDEQQKRQETEAELRWVEMLKTALEENRFTLAFQPVVGLKESNDEIYEVLLRMRFNEETEFKPGTFLPFAEKTGMIDKIDRWVISSSLQMLAKREDEGKTCLFVKLSNSAYADEALLPWLYKSIKAAGIQPRQLIFEINEKDVVTQIKKVIHFCRILHKMRCRTVISHFGMLDDPFQLLKTIPIDFIKASADLTSKIGSDPAMMERVTGMVETAHEMEKPIVAPHVEDAQSMAVLFQCGFDFIQGNFLQEPDVVMQYDFSDNEASQHASSMRQ